MTTSTSRWNGTSISPLVRLILGIVAVLVPVVIIQLLITSLPLPKLWQNILLGLLTPPVALATYYAFVHLVERRPVAELSQTLAVRDLVKGGLVGACLFGAVMAILALWGSLSITGTNPYGVILVPLIGAVTSGVFEEVLFRGVLFRILEDGLGSWVALLVSGAIFGGLHLLNANATVIGALAVSLTAGILLAACFMLTRRLWLPIGVHFAWNFTQSGIFGLSVSGNKALPGLLKASLSGPTWLTGGEFGPEASAVTVILGLLLGAIILKRAVERGRLVSAPSAQRQT